MNQELRAKAVERCFAFLLERGLFGETPEALAGQDYKVAFVSPLDTLINSTDVATTLQFAQAAAQINQLGTVAGAVLNAEEAVRLAASAMRVPHAVLRTPQEVAAIAQAQAEEQVEQQEIATQQQEASALRDTAQAAKNFSQAG